MLFEIAKALNLVAAMLAQPTDLYADINSSSRSDLHHVSLLSGSSVDVSQPCQTKITVAGTSEIYGIWDGRCIDQRPHGFGSVKVFSSEGGVLHEISGTMLDGQWHGNVTFVFANGVKEQTNFHHGEIISTSWEDKIDGDSFQNNVECYPNKAPQGLYDGSVWIIEFEPVSCIFEKMGSNERSIYEANYRGWLFGDVQVDGRWIAVGSGELEGLLIIANFNNQQLDGDQFVAVAGGFDKNVVNGITHQLKFSNGVLVAGSTKWRFGALMHCVISGPPDKKQRYNGVCVDREGRQGKAKCTFSDDLQQAGKLVRVPWFSCLARTKPNAIFDALNVMTQVGALAGALEGDASVVSNALNAMSYMDVIQQSSSDDLNAARDVALAQQKMLDDVRLMRSKK